MTAFFRPYLLWVVAMGVLPLAPSGGQQPPTVSATQDPSREPAGSVAALKRFTRTVDKQDRQEWDTAILEWQAFLRQFPDDALARQARNYLGVCLMQLKKYDDAAAEFSRVVAGDERDAIAEEALLNLGLCYYSKGFDNDRQSLVKAAKIFDVQIKTYEEGAYRDQALYFLAESLSMLEEHEKAEAYYRQLIDSYPESSLRVDALRALAAGQMGRGKTEDAQATLGTLAEQYPREKAGQDVPLEKAEALFAEGKWSAAAAIFADVAASNQKGADYALLRGGLCHEQAEEFLKAAEIYEQLEKRFPKSEFLADALLGAGRAYGLAQDTVNAERCLAKIQTDNADTAMEVAHWRCRTQLFVGHAAQAAEVAQTALKQYPDAAWRIEVQLDEAESLSLMPDQQTLAATKYLDIAKQLPDGEIHWRATLGAADCLLQIKKYQAAERIAEAFLSNHADNEHRPAFEYIMAESARLQADHENAQQRLQQLIQQFPQHPMVTIWRIRLAYSLTQCGRLEQALEAMQPVTQDNAAAPQFAEAMYLRGTTLRKLERMREAATALQLARAADPQGAWARLSQESLDEMAPFLDQTAAPEEPAPLALDDIPTHRAEPPAAPLKSRESELHAAALLAVDSGDVLAAVQAVSVLLSEFPQSRMAADALLYIGESVYANGDYLRAEKIFRKAVDVEGEPGTNQSALYKLAWAQVKLEKYPEALQSFTKLTESYPAGKLLADSQFMRGDCYCRLEQFEQALPIFKQLRADEDLAPHVRSRVLFLGARCLQKTGAWSESIIWLKELMKSDPQASAQKQAAFVLGLAYERTHDDDLALKYYRQAAQDGPIRAQLQAQTQIARILQRKGKFADAIQQYDQMIGAASGHGDQPQLQGLISLGALEAAQCARHLAETCGNAKQAEQWKLRGREFLEVASQATASDEIRQAANQLKRHF